jgi:hypothetical protein
MQLRSRRTREAASLDEPLDDTRVPAADRIVDSGSSPEQICLTMEFRAVLARSIAGPNTFHEVREFARESIHELTHFQKLSSGLRIAVGILNRRPSKAEMPAC